MAGAVLADTTGAVTAQRQHNTGVMVVVVVDATAIAHTGVVVVKVMIGSVVLL